MRFKVSFLFFSKFFEIDIFINFFQIQLRLTLGIVLFAAIVNHSGGKNNQYVTIRIAKKFQMGNSVFK